MARNQTIFLYNDTKQTQQWTVYSDGVINETYDVGQQRKTFTISLSGDVTIQFGVDDAVYLQATYNYASDTWTSKTDTPNVMQFGALQNGFSVTSSYTP